MRRLISWLLGLPAAVVVVLFALSNRGTVTMGLWPFADGLEVPAYAAALVPLALGLILGLACGGLGALRARAAAAVLRRRVQSLESELGTLRAAPTVPISSSISPASDETPKGPILPT